MLLLLNRYLLITRLPVLAPTGALTRVNTVEDVEERGLGNELVDDECVVFLWVERQAHIEDNIGMA